MSSVNSMNDTFTLPSAFQDGVEAATRLLDVLEQLAAKPADGQLSSLEPVYYAGYSALAAGRFEDAQATFMTLVAHAPKDPRFFAGLGKAQQGLGLLHEASMSLALANHLDPHNMPLRLSLAEVSLALKEYPHAQLLLTQVKALTEGVPDQLRTHERASALLSLLPHGS